jgi:hypothetical protein
MENKEIICSKLVPWKTIFTTLLISWSYKLKLENQNTNTRSEGKV